MYSDKVKLTVSHLCKFPPLWGQLLAWSAPGSKEVHKPHLVLCFTSNGLHEVFPVNVDHRGPQNIKHKVSNRLWIVIPLGLKN